MRREGGRSPAAALAIAYRSDTAYPETHWARRDFDALLTQANATVDAAERRRIYQEAQRLLAEEGGAIIPVFISTVAAMRADCSGYEANNNVNIQDYRTLSCE